MTSSEIMIAAFPDGLTIPPELIAYFRWLDEQGLYHNFDNEGYRYALIDPAHEQSCLCIVPPNPEYSKSWTGSDDPAVYDRLAIFCKTGGDGSHAALWRDDNGQTQIAHLGSGSGSTMMGVFAPNAIDFLRLLAIGYDELCWPEHHSKTPMQLFEENAEEEDEDEESERAVLPVPLQLQQWLTSTFHVTLAERASDIIGEVADMDSDDSDDPYWLWDHSLDKWK